MKIGIRERWKLWVEAKKLKINHFCRRWTSFLLLFRAGQTSWVLSIKLILPSRIYSGFLFLRIIDCFVSILLLSLFAFFPSYAFARSSFLTHQLPCTCSCILFRRMNYFLSDFSPHTTGSLRFLYWWSLYDQTAMDPSSIKSLSFLYFYSSIVMSTFNIYIIISSSSIVLKHHAFLCLLLFFLLFLLIKTAPSENTHFFLLHKNRILLQYRLPSLLLPTLLPRKEIVLRR